MVPDKSLTKASASRWGWMIHCWFLREPVKDLTRALVAIHATQTGQLEAVKTELLQERDARHLLKIELDALKNAQAQEVEALKLARDGNRALLRFIHIGHRMNVKFDPESIQAALQKANEK